MCPRRPIRELLLTVVVSHVLAIQGLLLAVSSGLAIADMANQDISAICSVATSANDEAPNPPGQRQHQACLSACLSGPSSGEPPVSAVFLMPGALSGFVPVAQQTILPAISKARAFLARAPPMLI